MSQRMRSLRWVPALLMLYLLACASVAPVPETPSPPQGPVAQRTELENGIVLLTLERPHLPVVAVEVEVAAGSAEDPTYPASPTSPPASSMRARRAAPRARSPRPSSSSAPPSR